LAVPSELESGMRYVPTWEEKDKKAMDVWQVLGKKINA